MDPVAVVLALLAILIFLWQAPVNWGLALLTAALIAQFTALTGTRWTF